MTDRHPHHRLLAGLGAALVALAVLLPTADALARAGGGTSSTGGSSASRSGGASSSRSFGGSSSGRISGSYRGAAYGAAGAAHLGGHDDHHDDDHHDDDHREATWGEALVGFLLFMLIFGTIIVVGLRQQRRQAACHHDPCRDDPAPPPPPPAAAAEAKRHARMDRTNEAFVAGLGAHDPAWAPAALKARVAEVYHKVQQAWTARNQDLAADCLTEELYRRHKRLTDHMIALGKRNVLEDVRLLDVDLVYVADREGKADDAFWAVVRGEMIDYEEILDWERYALACGAVDDEAIAALRERVAAEYRPATTPTAFAELWKFARDPAKGWVLAKIDHDLSQVDDRPRPFSDDTYPVA